MTLRNALAGIAAAAAAWLAPGAGKAAAADPAGTLVYAGACDASGAVALDDDRFVVANDEDSVLRIYRRSRPGAPEHSVDIASFLPTRKRDEVDLEAGARIGNRIYWITSHAASAGGKPRPERRQLFATDVTTDALPAFTLAGAPFHGLVDALAAAPALRDFAFDRAARIGAEVPGGLNIEGLAATPSGALLIGFRNPVPQGRALLVPLDNPDEVVRGAAPRLGAPVTLDLGGLGIRSIDFEPPSARFPAGSYLIAAGPVADRGDFRLYRWSGAGDGAAVRLPAITLGTLRPEAIIVFPAPRGGVLVLSDDGGVRDATGVACKDQPAAAKRFRAIAITP